jgi:hypothetical protein
MENKPVWEVEVDGKIILRFYEDVVEYIDLDENIYERVSIAELVS